MNIRVTTAAPYYPVSRANAKLWARIDSDDTAQDTMIDLLIAAMTDYAENITGRSFVQRSYELLLDTFPSWEIRLPRPPLLTIDSVKYYDTENVLQTLATSIYESDIYREPARLRPVLGDVWPAVYNRMNAVQIAYTAGYAPGSPDDEAGYREAVPDTLKLWLSARIATLYDNRDHLMRTGKMQIPRDFADGILDSLVVADFF